MATKVTISAPSPSRATFDLHGKRFIITGGSQGLGLEIAQQLKFCGAGAMVLMSNTKEIGETRASELDDETCNVNFVEVDLADADWVADSIKDAIHVLGGHVDGLVNAAAVTDRCTMLETTAEFFNRMFFVNTRAPMLLSQAVAKHMISTGTHGAIVNISSVTAKGGAPYLTAYSASKAALNSITKNNAAELAPHGIRVNALNLGWTLTENEDALMTQVRGKDWLEMVEPAMPLKRILRPVDAACSVCFLFSPAAAMMTGSAMDLHPDLFDNLLSSSCVEVPKI